MKNIKKNLTIKYFLLTILACILIFLDQYTKWLATVKLKDKEPFVIIKDVFEFRYLDGGNTGIAWGLFSGKIPVFIAVTIILIVAIIFFIVRIDRILLSYSLPGTSATKFKALQIILAVLLSGAIGNMIDRITLGYVVDFIYFKLINFPLFNVADCYVTVTEFILIFSLIFIFSDKETNILVKKINPKERDETYE